mmetsp:Transcript_110/g.248  ORF Transcript_110/g.248 Transcript_110/m.248 type:complete len:112 (+) Transcript_110:651-986(+)
MRPDKKFWSVREAQRLEGAVRGIVQRDRGSGGAPVRLYHSRAAINESHHVSDKYAVGTSAAMHYYLGAWEQMPRLWDEWRRRNDSDFFRVPVGERLLYAHMRGAPFEFRTY